MYRTLDRWLIVGFGLLAALLAVNAGLAYRNTRQLYDDAGQVARTHEVLDALDDLLSTLKDAETGQRGFLITGEARYLGPYDAATATLDDKVARARRLTEDSDRQQARIPELRRLIRAKLDELAHTVALRKGPGFEAARKEVLTDKGKETMDALRALVGEMRQEEQDVLRHRQQAGRRTYGVAVGAGLVGPVVGVVAVAAFFALLRRHLKARAKAAAVVHEQRELLQATLTSIGDALIATDAEGRVAFLNPVAQALIGWTADEARGQPLSLVFRIINEETRQPVEGPVRRALAEGRVVGLANHTTLVAKDGTERPIEDSAAPIRGNDGRTVGVILVFRDVSQRRWAEKVLEERRRAEAVRESEERFRLLVEGIADYAIFLLDPEGRVASWNAGAERIMGYTAEEVVGRHFSLFYPEEARARGWPEQELARAAADGRCEDEGWRARKDGSRFWANTVLTPLRDNAGRVRGFAKITRDLTERRQKDEALRRLHQDLERRVAERTADLAAANEALTEADRRKDDFLAMLAHELRNPLAPLRNAIQVMKARSADRQAVERAHGMVERQVRHLSRIVDDLLDVSRVQRGMVALDVERLDLARLARVVAEDHRAGFEQGGLALRWDVPEVPVWVEGDPTRLTQVLGNLLQNAGKFTERGGTVTVTVVADAARRQAVLSVRDTGLGIDADMLPRLFETFAQADRSLDRSKGGLGLGLSLVKGLAELHGGTAEAHSEGPGRGAEFVVRVPLQPEPAAVSGMPAAPRRAAKRLRVLVVEDNRDAADSLKMLLELFGYDVTVAYTGPTGVETAKEWRPDVVLCDIGLPGLDGYGVARELRQDPATARARMIAVTGYGADDDRRRSREAGFDAHLTKPADPAALQQLLGVADGPA